jgi:hypothetical protein
MPEKEVVIVGGVADIQGSSQNTGSVSGSAAYSGAISGSIPENTGQLSGVVTDANELNGNLASGASVSAVNVTEGVTGATLSIRVGQDGADGKDGFSPTITVHKDTSTEYILKITNKDGSYLTPNLYPDLEGLQDITTLVAGKVDEDLEEYPLMDPKVLTITQRADSYLYTRSLGRNRKIALSEVALEAETNEKIRKKLQTVEIVPEQQDWKVGDYILLDFVPKDK